jgi:predicted ATP-dependent serine protease
MKINIDKLLTVSNFAILKGLSRQHVYRLIENKELTLIIIDGVSFIFMDEKAVDFVRKRNKKINDK